MINPTRIGFILALIAMAMKVFAFYYGIGGVDQGKYVILLHLFLILLGTFVTVTTANKESDWVDQIKTGMKAVSTYAILYCIFLYFHYKYIDTIYFEERISAIATSLPEEGKNKGEKNLNSFFTPFNYATITLVSFMVSGAIYTFLITALDRKVLRNIKR